MKQAGRSTHNKSQDMTSLHRCRAPVYKPRRKCDVDLTDPFVIKPEDPDLGGPGIYGALPHEIDPTLVSGVIAASGQILSSSGGDALKNFQNGFLPYAITFLGGKVGTAEDFGIGDGSNDDDDSFMSAWACADSGPRICPCDFGFF